MNGTAISKIEARQLLDCKCRPMVEVDVVRFNRATDVWSFVFSGLLAAVFALLVNIIMHYKLKKIDMVESLKSVE